MLVPKLRFKREDGTEYPIWQKKSLNKCATFHSGLTYSPNDVTDSDNGVLVIRSTNIQNGSLVYNDNVFVNVVLSDKLKLRLNDTVMCVRNGSKTLVGKNALVKYEDLDKTWGAFMIVLRSIEPNCFIHHYLNSLYFKRQMDINAGTSTINQITSAMLNECILFVPTDIEEQQKIADFLSAVDEVIAQSQAEVQNLAQQKKAAMQKIFSQEVRFKREDGTDYPDWEEKNLSDICESIVGGGTPTTENKEYWNGSIAWVSSSDLQNDNIHYLSITRFITEDAISHSATKLIPQNSVLIVSRVGVGKVVIAPCQLCTSQDFTNLVNPQCNSVFLAYLLSVIMQKKASGVQGTSIKGITAKEIKMYDVSIPCLEEQQKIANFLSAYDEAITCAKQELEHWKQLKKGLLQQMFV